MLLLSAGSRFVPVQRSKDEEFSVVEVERTSNNQR